MHLSLPGSRRRILQLAAIAGVALAVPTSSASASGNITLSNGEQFTIPTWVFQNTSVCATAHTEAGGIYMQLDSQFPGAGPETVFVPRYTRRHTAPTCRSEWWAGAPLDISNAGLDPDEHDDEQYLQVEYH